MSTLLQKGFTAVELMIVLVIMAILILVASPSLIRTVNANKITATTNELLGVIEFARNTAKSTNKAVAISKCDDTETCGIKVTLLENTSATPLRVMHKSDMKNVTYTDDKKTTIVFYPDGTRGLHVNASSITGFNDQGVFDANAKGITADQAVGDYALKVQAKIQNVIYCRVITVTKLGSVKVATEGCTL